MSIRKKILIYFSATTISLLAIALTVIYILFSEYREEDFQQRQKEKIDFTLKFLTEIKIIDNSLIETIDRITINELYDEKLLIFDKNKKLIYTSVDDIKIPFQKKILDDLSSTRTWIETKDGLYDVIGVYVEKNDKGYYAISKAYDTYGYTKLNFLRNTLIGTFILLLLIIVLVSFYLSNKITKPIRSITHKITHFDFDHEFTPLATEESRNEVSILAEQFNQLMKRLNEAFSFQKHAIHHISHELKTPISVLVSNFERIEKEEDTGKIKQLIAEQKEGTKSLGEIISLLLEISKAESNKALNVSEIRIDELIFDVFEELNKIHPDFQCAIDYANSKSEEELIVKANPALIRLAFTNLMLNCIYYSDDKKAKISLANHDGNIHIEIENNGTTISKEEQALLFQHFFRGKNSSGKAGFGLGLVFTQKIIKLHGGNICYTAKNDNSNSFIIKIPLISNTN